MKIKLLTVYATEKKTLQIGQIDDFSKEEGQALIDGKFGILVDSIVVKTAVIEPVEIASINNAENLVIKQKVIKTKKSKKGKR